MKTIKYLLSIVLFVTAVISCNEDEFGTVDFASTVTAPANLAVLFDVTQDNTGLVTITPISDGAVSYSVTLGDDTAEPVTVIQGDNVQHTYAEGNYDVKIVATGITGLTAEFTQPLTVSFNAPENLNVVIENDPAVTKQVNVTVNADFAITFDVYFGEEGNDEPVSANIGETVSYAYAEAGVYTIRVVVKGAAIETTEYTTDFEAVAIVQPLASAPAPPFRAETDVISIFSDAYTNVEGIDYFPDWNQGSQGSSWAMFELEGDEMLQYVNLSYQGIDFGQEIDVTQMEYLHLDVWTPDVTDIEVFAIRPGPEEKPVSVSLTANEWTSIDIPLSDYTDQGLTLADIFQFKFVGTPWAGGTVFIDNLYFYRGGAFDGGLLVNGDFQNGTDSWNIDAANLVTDGDNTYYSVNVETAGNPWDVNMSQVLEIVEGQVYTLTFDAWSDTDRTIIAGIGLNANPWTADTETINITTSKIRYSMVLNSIDDPFGAPDARVIFDMGADVGAVNIDNVSLQLGEVTYNEGLVTNGNYENGTDSWNIDAANLVTEGDNTYYSVNVETAGNPWDVNMSQVLEIVEGREYTLTFDAWSDTDRSIIAGIGLNANPWTASTVDVKITTGKIRYSIAVNSIDDPFGAPDARVIFDMGADTGSVNIDNVSLILN